MIALLDREQVVANLESFVELLGDTVDHGASVGFLPPMDRSLAEQFWLGCAAAIEMSGRKLFGLFEGRDLAGTVQLQRAALPNGHHRADVMKLMVHTRYRGRGLSRALMDAVEAEARRMGITLLVLDTKQGDVAESLYRKLGWTVAGVIPGYAADAGDTFIATVIFYKQL